MKINTVPKDYIINIENSNGRSVSNFLLHGLNIKNDSDVNIELKEISFELYSEGDPVKQVSYRKEALEKVIKEIPEKRPWLEAGDGAGLFLGGNGFFNMKQYSDTVLLKPEQETGIFNEYFIAVSEQKLDELIISVTYSRGIEELTEFIKLPLIEYTCRNEYIFPLKGRSSTCGNYQCLLDHRQHYSMEFAFDMAELNDDQKLEYKNNMAKEDYIVFRKDVLAIADGEVVECYHSFDITTSWIWEERLPYIKEYGFMPAQCGNHIVLKHANGEYSFYGHLDKDSLTVNKGDKVKQGQVIAKVGHTGMSGCPHLHFQLMDGPDFLKDRGLPCSFTNIRNINGDKISSVSEDNMIVHAE